MRHDHHHHQQHRHLAVVAVGLLAGLVVGGSAVAKQLGDWSTAVPISELNLPAVPDGCPIESPDGASVYLASPRPGSLGANDIWVSSWTSATSTWSTPENLGAPVNSAWADYCPTPLPGGWLLFVSERPVAAPCVTGPGAGDLFLTRRHPKRGWLPPEHLGCAAAGTGPSFPGGEFGPSLVETDEGTQLYFSSSGTDGDMDVYMSVRQPDGSFGIAHPVDELNTDAADFMPNVRKDGLEVVLNSNRPGGLGGQDVYAATRSSTSEPWGPLVNLGPAVNTGGNETRASLSRDGERLLFGRDGEIHVSVRSRHG